MKITDSFDCLILFKISWPSIIKKLSSFEFLKFFINTYSDKIHP